MEDVADEIGRVIETANITADTIRSEQVAIAGAVVDQTRVETQQAISEVVQATIQQRDLDSHSVHNLLQQLTGVVSGLQASMDQRFDSIDTVLTNERTQTIRNNEDILRGFRRIKNRLVAVESRSLISEWGSVRHHMRGGADPDPPMANLPVYNTMRTGLPNIDAFLAEPSNQPPNSPPHGHAGRRSSPSPPRRRGHAPSPEPYLREGDISKFKSTITFDGTGNLTSFLFAMDKACAKYSLTSDWNRMLAMGECLRGGALD